MTHYPPLSSPGVAAPFETNLFSAEDLNTAEKRGKAPAYDLWYMGCLAMRLARHIIRDSDINRKSAVMRTSPCTYNAHYARTAIAHTPPADVHACELRLPLPHRELALKFLDTSRTLPRHFQDTS